ncbi:MAG TPA: alpha/beta hydrolase [Mycobacteriales bacterium]|nr:alpha/beta hydrolase [Mycobacteriales bacterium]
MGRSFQRLSTTGVLLTANALRPMGGANPLSIPSFFAGWLTSELAPHLLALTGLGTAVHLTHSGLGDRRDRLALGMNAAAAVGLGGLIVQSQHSHRVLERALTDDLGDDYVARLDPAPDRTDLATPWRQIARPFTMKQEDVRRVADLDYWGDGHPRHRLDVYLPRRGGTGLPVLLQIHGGAWVIGRKDQQGLPLMTHLAARGWVCVAPNYRLSPRAHWPEHLIDLKRSLAWIRDNIASYGGDPDFVAVTGGSAGGHLAAMLALTPNQPNLQPGFEAADTTVQACIPHYGVYDLAATTGTRAAELRRDRFLARVVIRRDPRHDREVYEQASPLFLAGPDAPPFFVVHGRHDSLVPVAETRAFVERLRTVSTSPVVYAELPGAQHAFDVFPSIRSAHVVRAVERFLRWVHNRPPDSSP